VLFFEDIDIVFKDEADFYPQLLKLLQMTKVPIVLSATSQLYLAHHLVPILDRAGIPYESVQFKVKRPKSLDLKAILQLISLFEGEVSLLLKRSATQLLQMKANQVRMLVSEALCSESLMCNFNVKVDVLLL
jgi:hypothetical protein